MWHDQKIRRLTDAGKLLFSYLLTSPHSNTLGIYILPLPYIMADLNWTAKQLQEPFAELLREQLIEYDESVSIIGIVNHLRYNPIENENQSKAAMKILTELPPTRLFSMPMKHLQEHYHEQLREQLRELIPEPETETGTETEYRIQKKKSEKKEIATIPPQISDVVIYGFGIGLSKIECEKYHDYHTARGWVMGKVKMKDWKAALRTWKSNAEKWESEKQSPKSPEGRDL